MKPILLGAILLVAGISVGAGTAYGVHILLPTPASGADKPDAKREPDDTSFTPTGKILAPLVFADGTLSGYVSFEVQLETTQTDAEFVTLRLPLLLNAINMRTYRAPMASGPGGMLPDLEQFRKLVMESSIEAFGPKVVRRAVIVQATPA